MNGTGQASMGAAGRWLAILGLGEDGVEGLSAASAALIENAALVVGGKRHLALADGLPRAERLVWQSPITETLPAILARRGEPVAVLASGDPYCFGIGKLLSRHVPPEETLCIPAPSSIALACGRLGWAQDELAVMSLCGRPLETLAPALQAKARLIVLSADAKTPAAVAAYLTARGFGPSVLHVMEALGGPKEQIRKASAESFGLNAVDALNLLAIEVRAASGAQIMPLSSGLADEWFEHDGQLTKREIRALTLSSLAPRQGELLWDIGCGSGSVAIEWLLRHPANTAIGIERDSVRAARAARNAASLGVPGLELKTGAAPEALAGLAQPDAVFVGGGANARVIETAWQALRPGGRMVVNAVTLETETCLAAEQQSRGGSLTRIGVERLGQVGGRSAFRPAMTVTQWSAEKR